MADSAPTTAQSTSFAVRVNALKNGLFQSLSVMQKRAHSNALLSIVGVMIKWLQLMAFLFISTEFKWDPNVIAPIRVLSLVPSPAGWFKVLSPTFLLVLYFISFVWVFLFCSLMVWTVRNFLRGQIPSLAPLRVLASIGQFSATVAYIPLLTLLLSVFMCDNVQPGMVNAWEGYKCMVDGHLALVVLSTIFATVFFFLAALFALVFFDSHPLSSNMAAKVHGRSEFVMLLVKTILILTIEIFAPQINNVWVLVALNIAAACTWISLTLYYMPFIHFETNAFHCALGCIYLWGGICLAMGLAGPWINVATLLYVGSPFSAVVGVWLTQGRRTRVLGTAPAKLGNVFEVDMKARFLLQQALEAVLEQAEQASNRGYEYHHDGAGGDESASMLDGVTPLGGGGKRAGKVGGGSAWRGGAENDNKTAHFEGVTTPRSAGGDAGRGKRAKDSRSRRSGVEETDAEIFAATYKACDAESRERMVRDKLPSRVLLEVEALYKNGATRFPHSAILHMFDSRFFAVFKNDRYLATSHLLLANRLSPALDVAFLSFQARRAAETASGSGVLSSAMHRVAFDKHLADARLHTMRAARDQVSFWQELCDAKPDINRLHSISSDLTLHTSLADKHFKEAFLLHPQSLSAMRLFAQYNMSVANNPEKAAAISAEADRIEDQKNKEQSAQRAGASTDGFPFLEEVPLENMADAVAMLTVGASSRDLGIILSANSAACKIFGYTRLQLERRNVSVVVPAPFMENHDGYLRRYMSTGEGVFIETSRQILAQHRLGHLVPVTIALRETALSDGTLAFIATLRPLSFTDHVVMMNEDWVIQGATAGALMALQVEAATLSASEVCMADYCPVLDNSAEVQELLGKVHGDVLQMRLPGYANSSKAGGGRGSVSVGEPSSVRSPMGGRGGAFSPNNGMWSDQALEVKACLASQVIKGHTVNILTFRLLSTNESAQRANALASRRASLVAGEGVGPASGGGAGNMSARPSFQRFVKELRATGGGQEAAPLMSQRSQDSGSSGPSSPPVPPEGHPLIPASSFLGATCPVVGGGSSSSSGAGVKRLSVPALDMSAEPRLVHSSSKGKGKKAGGVRISEATSTPRKSARFAVQESSEAAGDVPAQVSSDEDADSLQAEGGETGRAEGPVPLSLLANKQEESSKEEGGPFDYARERSGNSERFDESALERDRRASFNDGRGSVKSGGSSKRSGIGRGTVNKLRRIIAETTGDGAAASKSTPGLSALYTAGWLLILFNLALASLSAALLDTTFSDLSKNLRFSQIAGDASQVQIRALGTLAFRQAFKAGWFPVGNATDLILARELGITSDDLASVVRDIYNLIQGTPKASFLTRPDLAYADLDNAVVEPTGKISDALLREMLLDNVTALISRADGGVVVGTKRRTSFMNFAADWSAKLKALSNIPLAQFDRSDDRVLWILLNTQAGSSAAEYVKRAVYEAYEASMESRAAVETLVFWIFIAMGPCLSVLLLLVIVPILLYVDFKRDNVMEAFLDIPTLMALHLRAGAEARLRSLRADDEDADDADEEEDEEEMRRALNMGGEDAGGGAGDQFDHEDGAVDWEAVITIITVEASREEKKRAKRAGMGAAEGSDNSTAVTVYKGPGESAGAAGVSPSPALRKGSPLLCCCARSPAASQRVAAAPSKRGAGMSEWCGRGARAPTGGYYRSVVNPDGTTSTFIRRDFIKTRSILRPWQAGFLLPVLFMFIFYLTLYLVTNDTVSNVMSMASFASLASIRASQTRAVRAQLIYTASTPGYAPEVAFRTEWLNKQIATLDYVNKLVAFDLRTPPSVKDNFMTPYQEYVKASGSEISFVPGLDPEQMRTILNWQTRDACAVFARNNPSFNTANCRSFNRGILTSGLQAAMDDYLLRVRRLRDRRWRARGMPANTTTGAGFMVYTTESDWAREWEGREIPGGAVLPGVDILPPGGMYIAGGPGSAAVPGTSVQQVAANLVAGATVVARWSIMGELLGEDFNTAFSMVADYLLPAFGTITNMYGSAGETLVNRYRLFLIAFVGGFLGCFVLGMLLFFLPAIRVLGVDVQSKRAMLLLLPAPVIAHVASLRVMVLRIVEEHEGAAGAGLNRGKAGAAAGGGGSGAAGVDCGMPGAEDARAAGGE